MLRVNIFQTSAFVKTLEEEGISKSWVWQNIHELEKSKMIKRVNPIKNQKTRVKHKKLFNRESLRQDYNIIFIDNGIEDENIKKG